jgi:hypothetical protein
MAQPSSEIAEAFCGGDEGRAGDARLRGDSISSKNSLDPSTCADLNPGAQWHRSVTDHKDPRFRPSVFPEATLVPPDQPAGLVGVNTKSRVVHGEDAAAAPRRRKDAPARFGNYSAALLVCLGGTIVAYTALHSLNALRPRELMTQMLSVSRAFMGAQPRLVIEAQEGEANEPLPLGVTVEHAPDGAIVTIEAVSDAIDLSLGNRSDTGVWTVTATDLERTFVGPPQGFVGAIEATAILRAASGGLLDRQALRFEWRANKGKSPDPAPAMIKKTVRARPLPSHRAQGRLRPNRSSRWPHRRRCRLPLPLSSARHHPLLTAEVIGLGA